MNIMKKYRLAIYTDPDAETLYQVDVDMIGQGLILAKDWGYRQYLQCQELKNIQWHIIIDVKYIKEDEISLVIGQYLPNGDLRITHIIKN